MPKISVHRHEDNDWWFVRFEYKDLEARSFGFATKEDALNAIKLGQYFRDNEIAIKDIEVED